MGLKVYYKNNKVEGEGGDKSKSKLKSNSGCLDF